MTPPRGLTYRRWAYNRLRLWWRYTVRGKLLDDIERICR